MDNQNKELNALLDKINAQKASMVSELKAAQLILDKECQQSLSQLDRCSSRIWSLQPEMFQTRPWPSSYW
jgi:hypothetical protein